MLDPQDASRPQDYNPDLAKYGLGASVDRILVCSEDYSVVAGFTFHLKKEKYPGDQDGLLPYRQV